MTVRSFPQPISRGNANGSLDLYPSTEQRLVAALQFLGRRGRRAVTPSKTQEVMPNPDAATAASVTPGGCRPRAFAAPKTKAAR